MMTKINMYKSRSLNASTITLLIAIGLFVGGFVVRSQYAKNINIIQNELTAVQNELYENKDILEQVSDELDVTKEELLSETNRANELNESLIDANTMLEEANATLNDLKSNEYKLVYIGNYKLTHYCTEKRKHICGTGTGLTATGTKVTAGRSIAVDPKVIPYGSKVYIEGYGWRTAEDCGGGVDGKHIDVAVGSHSQALSMGTKTRGVWILVKNNS